MNNYEYIIASLPVLQRDAAQSRGIDADAIVDEIRSQCSDKDRRTLATLLSGWSDEALCADFYREAEKDANPFIREYFLFDRRLRNAKVEYLNRSLGRPEGQDCIFLSEDEDADFEELAAVKAVLESGDILARERGLDEIMWDKADDLVEMHIFDLDTILAFIVKLKIVDRWLKLDPESGRALFHRLVEEIKNTKTI